MQSKATTVDQYIDELPEDRKNIISELRKLFQKNLPKGFEEGMGYGMIGYYVPHKLYPKGYHCDPKLPLPFLSVASQKNHIAIYHMGIYATKELLQWFEGEWPKHSSKKLDMGKSCLKFKKAEDVPLKLIAELAKKVTPQQWIETYENAFVKK
ncbi:MAG: DUF1801 domain-containing protein [Chitinophagaceae bacterium]|nr:DUF1801 domain-containing protein [Chitinophagaceae bacterium]